MKTLIITTEWRNEEPKTEEWMLMDDKRAIQYFKTIINAYEKGHIVNFTIRTKENKYD